MVSAHYRFPVRAVPGTNMAAVKFKTYTKAEAQSLASYPGSFVGGKRAWYTLRAHAFNRPGIPWLLRRWGPPLVVRAYEISNLAKYYWISRKISRLSKDFWISREISGFLEISLEISRFLKRFLDFPRDF